MTVLSFPVVYTVAVEIIKEIHTLGSVLTGVAAALIHINITQVALPATRTHTLEGADAVDAGASISTRVR